MGYKMKGFSGFGKDSPIKKDPPGKKPKYVSVFAGAGKVDVSTPEGKKLLKEINSIPTVSSSDPKLAKNYRPNVKKKAKKLVNKAKKVAKTAGKIGGKMLMGGIVDPTNKQDPRLIKRIQKANTKKFPKSI